MIYLIGALSGAVSGIAMALIVPISLKLEEKNMKFSKFGLWEKRIYIAVGFIVITFLLGPFLSYMYSLRFAREGTGALWNHAFVITIPALAIIGISIRLYKNYWKSFLLYILIFLFGLGWFLPLLYNWIIG